MALSADLVCALVFAEAWQSKEIDLFESAYLKVGKQFAKIAARVGSKSCAECINFYYLWKKKARGAATKGPRLVQKRKYPDIQVSTRAARALKRVVFIHHMAPAVWVQHGTKLVTNCMVWYSIVCGLVRTGVAARDHRILMLTLTRVMAALQMYCRCLWRSTWLPNPEVLTG